MEAVGKVWSRDMISQTGGVERKDDARHFDSNLPAKLSSAWRADVDLSALRELELLSDTSAAVSQPTNPPDHPPSANPASANPPSVMRSKRMSSVSEQDHLNPRDPLYYAPRSLRERSAIARGKPREAVFCGVVRLPARKRGIRCAAPSPRSRGHARTRPGVEEGVVDRRGALRRRHRRRGPRGAVLRRRRARIAPERR